MKGISFILEGDLACFRNPATLSFFETFLCPQRTTILGLIGASLGYSEKDTYEVLAKKLKIGIEILEINGFAREIIRLRNLKGKEEEKTPTMRNLLVKPRYRIYLGLEENKLFEKISRAIEKPKFPPYLGSSDFLAFPITKITLFKTLTSGKENLFECVVPEIRKIDWFITDRIKNNKREQLVIPAKKYKTVGDWKITDKGRIPEFIDLIVGYNCLIKTTPKLHCYYFAKKPIILF